MTALMMSRLIGSARCPSYAAFADALGIAAAITGARIGFGQDTFDAWLNGESPLSFASRVATGHLEVP